MTDYTVIVSTIGEKPRIQEIKSISFEGECVEGSASYYGVSGRDLKAIVYANHICIYRESEHCRETLYGFTKSKALKIIRKMVGN
jgi:hypothetical protein